MFYYFSAEFPSVIKLNGLYYGIISDTIKRIKIDSAETFLEVCPINSVSRSYNFLLDENFLSSPPENVCITDLKGGYLIKFLKSYSGGEFKVLGQEKYSDLLVTAFNDNGVKISIETANDFFAEPIFFELSSATFHRTNLYPALLAVEFLGKKTLVNVYETTNKIQKVFSRVVDEFCFDKEFSTTEIFSDMAKHKVSCTWQYENRLVTEKAHTVSKAERFNKDNLPDKLIPFAFMEELLVKGDFREYLCGNVLDNADKLFGFFGEFIGVMPPPEFRDVDEVGLIYNTRKNCYKVEYFRFELTDKKISNVKRCD